MRIVDLETAQKILHREPHNLPLLPTSTSRGHLLLTVLPTLTNVARLPHLPDDKVPFPPFSSFKPKCL